MASVSWGLHPALQHPRDREVTAATPPCLPRGSWGMHWGHPHAISSWEGGRCCLEQGGIPGVSSTGLGPSLLGSSLSPVGESGGGLEPGFLHCRVLGGGGVRVLGKATEPSLPAEPAEPPPPVPLALPPQPGWHRLPFGCCEYLGRGSWWRAPALSPAPKTLGRCCHPIPAGTGLWTQACMG